MAGNARVSDLVVDGGMKLCMASEGLLGWWERLFDLRGSNHRPWR